MFYKYVENDFIVHIGKGNRSPSSGVEITPEKYAELKAKTKTSPADTLEAVYRLSNETETYVPRERTHEETVNWYMVKVSGGEMTIDEVPEEYRAEVEEGEATEADYISALAKLGVQ